MDGVEPRLARWWEEIANEPPEWREVFSYLLAMVSYDAGLFEPVRTFRLEGRKHLVFTDRQGRLFKVVRPRLDPQAEAAGRAEIWRKVFGPVLQ